MQRERCHLAAVDDVALGVGAGDDHVVDQWNRRNGCTGSFGDEREVDQRSTTSTAILGCAHPGRAELPQLVPQVAGEAERFSGAHVVGAALGGEETVEDISHGLLRLVELEVERHPATRVVPSGDRGWSRR